MHREAFEWVFRYRAVEPVAVLDIGGRNINGSVRDLFPLADPYVAVDIADGPGVDIVADASTWVPDREYDVVVCCEVFEHTPVWPQICQTAFKACRSGGRLILTMAGIGRPAHSGVDGGPFLHGGEHYANISPDRLRDALQAAGWAHIILETRQQPADLRAVATKPGEAEQ